MIKFETKIVQFSAVDRPNENIEITVNPGYFSGIPNAPGIGGYSLDKPAEGHTYQKTTVTKTFRRSIVAFIVEHLNTLGYRLSLVDKDLFFFEKSTSYEQDAVQRLKGELIAKIDTESKAWIETANNELKTFVTKVTEESSIELLKSRHMSNMIELVMEKVNGIYKAVIEEIRKDIDELRAEEENSDI